MPVPRLGVALAEVLLGAMEEDPEVFAIDPELPADLVLGRFLEEDGAQQPLPLPKGQEEPGPGLDPPLHQLVRGDRPRAGEQEQSQSDLRNDQSRSYTLALQTIARSASAFVERERKRGRARNAPCRPNTYEKTGANRHCSSKRQHL